MRLGPGLLRLGMLRAFFAEVGDGAGAGAAEEGPVVRFRILQEWRTHHLSFGGSHHFLPDHRLHVCDNIGYVCKEEKPINVVLSKWAIT